MQQSYKFALQKLRKYNEWERARYHEKSVADKLLEFKELFKLTFLVEVSIREREQSRHLQNLVVMQGRIIKALRHLGTKAQRDKEAKEKGKAKRHSR
jgi:hypothetical protein